MIHVGTHQRTHVYTCLCICMMHMYMHVRMSAYIGKITYQKYKHLCLLRAHEFVHTHTPTYNLRHSARKHFNTQIHTHTNTHANTGMHACMHAHMQTRVLQIICSSWYSTCGTLIDTSCVLLYYAISCIRAYAYRIWSCTLLCVYYMTLHLHTQIHTRKCVNISVHLYM